MYQIYSKLGVLKYESDNLEYNGEFMGVCNVSMNIESPYPIYFRIGDYVIYRGERFELNYIPTGLKQSSSGSYGAAYKYDNVVFNSLSDELTNCMFYDYVHNDNLIHYSSLPVFSFYADSISALADRIQVNLDRIYEGERKWTVIVHPEYVNDKNKNISVNNITVWDALALANTEFKANFIIRGRTITIGTAGLSIGKLFSYGEGNGLYSIQKTAESGQRIVTRLRAYGSTRNMPLRYYSDANKSYVATVTDKVANTVGVDSNITVFADFDLGYSPQLFTTKRVKQGEQKGWVVKVELEGTIVTGVITSKEGTVRNCQLEVFYDRNAVDDNGIEPSYEAINAFKDKIEKGSKVKFVAGISKANFPNEHIVHEIDMPSNFAINNLMLPSFPTETLDPYIDSENIEELGVREWSIFFDGSNTDLPEIYPSIEGMTADELKSAGIPTESTGKLDEIAKQSVNADGTAISDSGEYAEGETVPNFKIYLKDIGFDINDYLIPDQSASISMTSGMCGGREFEILGGADKPYKEDGMWILTCHRQEDSALNLYFPYKDYTIEESDTFVLLNIAMPKEYIKAASQRLLTESKAWLSKNDFVRYSYEPKVDEVLMMKNPELHDSIKEGDLMLFNDEDLGIDGSIIIEKLSIKEGDSAAPTYEVVLRNDKVVGTIEKIQNQIDSIVSGGGQGSGGYTAQQINKFISTYGEKYFLSKNKIDAAKEIITFEKGIVLGKEENAKIDDKGRAELLSGVVKELLRSKTFVDGLSGQGWKIWMENALSHMTVDKLTVRQTMVAFEMLIDKIRSVGGSICVSAANGKIKSVEEDDNGYFVTFEQDNTFVQHDLIRCSTFSGDGLKNYWAEVSEVDGDRIFLSKSEFDSYIPETGDECVLMGNTTNTQRQNMILISATEDGQPRIDVMDGVKDKNFDGCIRMRAGNLDGINDDWFPIDNQPHGNGIYSDNAYLRGTFLLVTGEDIRTKFEIVEGKITSSIEALRDDLSKDVGYLNNPSFSEGLDKWNTQNEATFFLVNNKWIWANNNVLSKRGNSAKVLNDDGRMVVELHNSYIIQKRENLKSVPTMPQNVNGDKEAIPIFLNFFYKCKKEGTLNVTFNNVDKTGFVDFESMDVTETLSPTDGYVEYSCNGFWNGTGDFKLTFTGDIYLYMLVLSTDKLESLVNKYKTLFEQSDRLVKISAAVFDKNEQALKETGLLVTSEMTGLYAIGEDGNLKSFVGAGQDGVKIKASNITLEGVTTINGRFKILEDGSMEADKAKIKNSELDAVLITGAIKTPFRNGYFHLSTNGPIELSTLGLQNNNNVVIPGSGGGFNTYIQIPFTSEYNGFRAVIMNDDFNGENSDSAVTNTAPEGKYYFEDGQKKKTLNLLPHTGVEMIGYGEGSVFHGWIILNRIYKGEHLGYASRTMFCGVVRNNSIIRLKTYNNENLKLERIGEGHYRISFELPFSDENNYAVFLTGFAENYGRYASLRAQTKNYFDVYTGDDGSPNDGGFQFMVVNTSLPYMDKKTVEE